MKNYETKERSYHEKYNLPPTKGVVFPNDLDNYQYSKACGEIMREYTKSLTPAQMERYIQMKNDEYVRSIMPYDREGLDFPSWRENLITALRSYRDETPD